MSRLLVALPAIGSLAAIAGAAASMLTRVSQPGSAVFIPIFFGGLALPYLVTLALLTRGDGRGGICLAAGTAAINALWSLPLAALFVLLSGFAMGNRDQLHAAAAVGFGALMQVALLAAAVAALRQTRGDAPVAPLAPWAWPTAILLPLVFSGGSLAYLAAQVALSKQQIEQSMRNHQTAQATLKALRACLEAQREGGFPATLDACTAASAVPSDRSGYRFEYLPALPGKDGRVAAYFLCGVTREFRVEAFVVDSSADGDPALRHVDLKHEPACASIQGVERAIAWCAYSQAAREPLRGYPRRLADIAQCVKAGRKLDQFGSDSLSIGERTYAYLAGDADANGRTSNFRIHRRWRADGMAPWIDAALQTPPAKGKSRREVLRESTPALAAPETFEPQCAAGEGAACYVAGQEWQRKAYQSTSNPREPEPVPMRQAALQAFEKGCALGEPLACSALAGELERGKDTATDVVRAAQLYDKACAAGDGLGCHYGAQLYEKGRAAHSPSLRQPRPPPDVKPDLPADPPRAVELYSRACELDEHDACFSGARMLSEAQSVPRDVDKATALLARACDAGQAQACSRAADLAPGQALAFRQRACAFGLSSECRP
jgi:TPR repeat protein